MNEIKQNLKDIIETTMIPEVEDYLEELHKLIEKKEATDDDMEAIRDMESFLVELENVLLAIEKEKLDDEKASEIYERILNLIEESKDH